jgi:hypothetical protein
MDLFKTKRSPARGWLLVLGALTLVGAAALLSSCSAGEDEPVDEEHAISVRPGKKTLKSPEEVEEELKGKGETITLTIDKDYENAPGGTWERLLQIIEAACKKEDEVEVESLPVVYKNGTEYWFPEAKKFVKLDLSATSLAVYGDRDNDGKYNGYGDNNDNDNDDYDGDGVFVFDPRNPVHEMFVAGWAPEITTVVHYPYGYDFDDSTLIGYPGTGEPYITELTLPDKATAIAGTEFADSVPQWTATFAVFTRLAKVTANGVEIINEYAFYRCGSALAEASFPKVKSIGFSAFEGCEDLTRLFLPADPPELFVPARYYHVYNSSLFSLVKNRPSGDRPWYPRTDMLFIYVNGDEDEDAVGKYVKEWGVAAIEDADSKTEVYFINNGSYYHKPVTIEALKWSNGTK